MIDEKSWTRHSTSKQIIINRALMRGRSSNAYLSDGKASPVDNT